MMSLSLGFVSHPQTFLQRQDRFEQAPSLRPDATVLSIDVGTSATKAALLSLDDATLVSAVFRTEHETQHIAPLHVSQRKQDWLNGVVCTSKEALHQLVPQQRSIVAVTVTGQMQDLVGVGRDTPAILRNDAILYSDTRAYEIAGTLSSRLGRSISATSLLAKLKLLPSHERVPQGYSILLGAADYVVYAICREPKPAVTDATTVSTTDLSLGPAHRSYNEELLGACSLTSILPLLPRIIAGPDVVGHISEEFAEAVGRKELTGVPVVHAGGDAFSATAGAGCLHPESGRYYMYCGTSGWVGKSVASSELPKCENGLFVLGHHGTADASILAGSVASVGGSIHHACEQLLNCDINDLDQIASASNVGANGVYYVPYLNGRRCPSPMDETCAGLYGMRGNTTRGDVARAVIEGVLFSLYESAQQIPVELSQEPIRLVGGVAKSSLFVTGVAALFDGAEVCYEEAGLVGACLAARCALGLSMDCTRSYGIIMNVSLTDREKWRVAHQKWREVVCLFEAGWTS